ncbi:hypothetical protein F5Y11DRAFT_310670 [Daldinia sp. FL1419]|nr:hypothetical protein F5Y11DRAFT_310670 [Daldinia sp. FL1419]
MAAPQWTNSPPRVPNILRWQRQGDEHNVTDTKNVSLLLYFRDIEVQDPFRPQESIRNWITNNVELIKSQIQESPFAVDYRANGRRTHIMGSTTAKAFMREVDGVYDFARARFRDPENTLKHWFGTHVFEGLNFEEMLAMCIYWCRHFISTRSRFLEEASSKNPLSTVRGGAHRENRLRANVANRLLHSPNLAQDASWVDVKDVVLEHPVGRNTRLLERAYFERVYHLTREEASTLVRLASSGSHYQRFFSYVIYFIDVTVGWFVSAAAWCHTQLPPNNHQLPAGHPGYLARRTFQSRLWEAAGVRHIHTAYENFLALVLRLARAAQAGEALTPNMLNRFNGAKWSIREQIANNRLFPRHVIGSNITSGVKSNIFFTQVGMLDGAAEFTYNIQYPAPRLPPIQRRPGRIELCGNFEEVWKPEADLFDSIIAGEPHLTAFPPGSSPPTWTTGEILLGENQNPPPFYNPDQAWGVVITNTGQEYSNTNQQAEVEYNGRTAQAVDDDEASVDYPDSEDEFRSHFSIGSLEDELDGEQDFQELEPEPEREQGKEKKEKGQVAAAATIRRRSRLTASALLRSALGASGSRKRSARTPLREALAEHAGKRVRLDGDVTFDIE